jgi:predicted transcriptional regulator
MTEDRARAIHANTLLLPEEAKTVKKLLWEGHLTQSAIADLYKITQPTISRIYRGMAFSEITWPDETTGAISNERRRVIHSSRNRNTQYTNSTTDMAIENSKQTEQASLETAKVVEALSSADDNALADGLAITTPKTPRKGTKKPATNVANSDLTFEDIKERDPSHPIIRRLAKHPSSEEEQILVNICSRLPEKDWGTPKTLRLIKDLINNS